MITVSIPSNKFARKISNKHFIALLIMVLLFMLPFCATFAEEHEHEHGHGHEEGNKQASISERMEESCEHNMLTFKCDKCRFEVGAVMLSSATQALVKIEEIKTGPAPRTIDLVGELALDENHQSVVTSRTSGRLASLTATIGTKVTADSVVAIVESGELAQAVLDYLKRISELNLAEKKLARAKLLFEKKIGAEQSLQEAESARDLADLELKIAYDRLKIFGLTARDIERVKKNRNDSLVQGKILLKSAIDGVVIQRDGIAGEIVAGDRKLLTIANICHLKAVGQIYEKQLEEVLATLKLGAIPVSVTVEAFPEKTFSGELISADMQMIEDTRTLPVRIIIENPDLLLRPGMFAKIRLYLETAENQTLLPTTAIMEDEGSRFVFKQIEPNLFFREEIKVGRTIGSQSVILSGINSGDIIAVEGAFLLKSDVLREKMGAGCAD